MYDKVRMYHTSVYEKIINCICITAYGCEPCWLW